VSLLFPNHKKPDIYYQLHNLCVTFQVKEELICIRFEGVGENSCSRKPSETLAFATGHSLPSKACSSLLASGSQLEAATPLSAASLYTCNLRVIIRVNNSYKR